MAQYLTELCQLLLENQAGELSAQIFAALAEHGRLPLHTLAQHAQAPVRRIRHCLTSLLEQQLVLHFAAEDDAPTFYAVNWRNIYGLARSDNIVQLVTDRYGERAGQIVNNIQQLGHARVGDLAEAYQLENGSQRDSAVDTVEGHVSEEGLLNGISKSGGHAAKPPPAVPTTGSFHATVRRLLQSGILVKVGTRAFIPPPDLQEQIEETVISEQFPDRKVTGPKKQAEFKIAVNNLKRKWRADDAYSDANDLGSKGSIRRPGEIFKGPNKRAKVNGNLPNGVSHHHSDADDESGIRLSNDLIVRVDSARCTIALRSQKLQQVAKRYCGPVTSAVYRGLLLSLEGKLRSMRVESDFEDAEEEERKQPVATVSEVLEFIDPTLDLSAGIKGLSSGGKLANGVSKSNKKPRLVEDDEFAEIGIKHEYHSESDDEPTTNGFTSYRDRSKRLSFIEAHLALLEEHNLHFCARSRAHGNSNEWRVNFPGLTKSLIDAELDATMQARYGKIALRVVRMLRERGRLDEKQVSSFAMMRIKDVRAILTHLQFHGVLEAQELPKDNSRQPSRTLYLWFYDSARAQQLVLQQTYKAMARTLQRVQVERERYRAVIEKAERTDVKGHEAEKLELGERQYLREWRELEERMLAQVSRLDDVVALLRDFSGKDTSLSS